MVRNNVYESTYAGVPTKGYFLALRVTISITFAILQVFIISKATSIDRSFNLNRVLLRDIGIFSYNYPELPASKAGERKCNYSECFHKNKTLVGCQSTVN